MEGREGMLGRVVEGRRRREKGRKGETGRSPALVNHDVNVNSFFSPLNYGVSRKKDRTKGTTTRLKLKVYLACNILHGWSSQ
jgi:hypothetical protein